MAKSDAKFIEKCLRGDKESFGCLVERYMDSALAYVYSRVGNVSDAEDIAQLAFIKAYEELPSLKNHDSFVSWLIGIARQLCADWLRDQKKRPGSLNKEGSDPNSLFAPEHGNFTLGEDSYGTDLYSDPVTVKVGAFEQEIPAASFQKAGDGGEYHFRSQEPGIRFMSINARKGTFKADARDVNLDGTTNPLPIELATGHDEGSETIRLRGNLEYEGHEDEDHHDDHGD